MPQTLCISLNFESQDTIIGGQAEKSKSTIDNPMFPSINRVAWVHQRGTT